MPPGGCVAKFAGLLLLLVSVLALSQVGAAGMRVLHVIRSTCVATGCCCQFQTGVPQEKKSFLKPLQLTLCFQVALIAASLALVAWLLLRRVACALHCVPQWQCSHTNLALTGALNNRREWGETREVNVFGMWCAAFLVLGM